jgi:RNA polymerase primary sigma factor
MRARDEGSVMTTIVNGINVAAHAGLVATVAKRYRGFVGGCLEWDDLLQAGWLGVHRAAQLFDHSLGFKFSTYSQHWIRTFIQREVMNTRRTIRVPVHAQESARLRGDQIRLDLLSLNAPLDAGNPDAEWIDFIRSDSDPAAEAERADLREHIGAAVDALPAANRRAIRGRFWGDHTLNELGDDEGLSRERIRQREAKALDSLYVRLGKLGVGP